MHYDSGNNAITNFFLMKQKFDTMLAALEAGVNNLGSVLTMDELQSGMRAVTAESVAAEMFKTLALTDATVFMNHLNQFIDREKVNELEGNKQTIATELAAYKEHQEQYIATLDQAASTTFGYIQESGGTVNIRETIENILDELTSAGNNLARK
jgi:hypothetical protein